MIFRDPKCVFVADSVAQATVVANWLETEGIPSRVMDLMTLGGLEGLNAWTGTSARGIEVWVLKPEDIDRALKLIEKHEDIHRIRSGQDEAARCVLVFCEACGATTEFSAEQRDSTQPCPQCGATLRVFEEDVDDERRDDDDPVIRLSVLRSLQKPIILLMLLGIGAYLCLLLFSAVRTLLSDG